MAFLKNTGVLTNALKQSNNPFKYMTGSGLIFLFMFIGIHIVNTTQLNFYINLENEHGVKTAKIKNGYTIYTALEEQRNSGTTRVNFKDQKYDLEPLYEQSKMYVYKLYGMTGIYFLLFLGLNALVVFYHYDKKEKAAYKYATTRSVAEKYWVRTLLIAVIPSLPITYMIYKHTIITEKTDLNIDYLLNQTGSLVLLAFMGLFYGMFYALKALSNLKDKTDEHISGTKVVEANEYAEILKKKNIEGVNLTPEIKLDRSIENEHIFIIGQPGVGKTSVVMNRLITQQLNFPDNEDAKWIINELKFGTFTGAFYNPETDFFYDPGLKGSIAFNPFDYIFDLEDLTSIVELLTVDMPSDQKDPGWRSMATGLLTGIVALAEAKGQKTLEGLAELISKDPVELLSEISKVVVMDQNGNISEKSHGISSAVRYLSADEKQLSIYMGVFETKMVYFKNLVADPSQTPLNLEEWLNSKGQSKLFIMTRIKNASQAEIRNAALISTLFQAIMNKPNRPEDMNKRYYFVLDEAGNLGKIAGLDLATSLGRSYGISVLLSVQSIGQLDIKYTKEIRQTLIDSMGTSIIFRVKDPDTAKWLSEAIGEHTVKRYTDSINYGVEQNKGGGGENSSQVTEPAVKPSDILGLEKFQYYFKQPTSSEWVYVHTKFYEKPENGMYDILTNPHGEFKLPEKVESLKVQFVYNDSAATAIEKFKDDDKF